MDPIANQPPQHDYVVKQKLRELIHANLSSLPVEPVAHVYRVPDEYRIGNEQHFQPKKISIGLLHAENKKLTATKGMKKTFLDLFIQHLSQVQRTQEQLVYILSKYTKSFIKYYDNVPDALKNERSDDFLEVLLLDSCFIVQLLLMYDWESINTGKLLRKEDEALVITLQRDLLKFENQLPFSVLIDLAALALPNVTDSRQKLVESALIFFEIPYPELPIDGLDDVKHLLELVLLAWFPRLRPSLTPPPANYGKGSDLPEIESILNKARSASELVKYGITFKPKDTRNLADIEFKQGVLYIPRLEIDENTPSMAWNFLIFELYRESGTFLSYVTLMDILINSQKDVEVLIHAGVLKVWFNDLQFVVCLFDKLSTNVNPSGFLFKKLLHDLNTYCEASLRPLRAEFMRKYYADRWDMLNSILLFILTITQTLFSILAYDPLKNRNSR